MRCWDLGRAASCTYRAHIHTYVVEDGWASKGIDFTQAKWRLAGVVPSRIGSDRGG
jgi:hypothetical protein